jgi:hypothetical protein
VVFFVCRSAVVIALPDRLVLRGRFTQKLDRRALSSNLNHVVDKPSGL